MPVNKSPVYKLQKSCSRDSRSRSRCDPLNQTGIFYSLELQFPFTVYLLRRTLFFVPTHNALDSLASSRPRLPAQFHRVAATLAASSAQSSVFFSLAHVYAAHRKPDCRFDPVSGAQLSGSHSDVQFGGSLIAPRC